MTGRILVGVDGSGAARLALAWALEEAALRRSVLEAVIVWESPYDLPRDFYYPVDEQKLVERAAARLAEAVAAVPARGPVALETLVLEGDPAETLCRHAAGADLLVVGSRGRGTFAGLLLGSVSSKCAHHSPTPVVIVPASHRGGGDEGSGSPGRVVVGVDTSAGSLQALGWAADEAVRRGAVLEALMVRRAVGTDAHTLAAPPTPQGSADAGRAGAERAEELLARIVADTAAPHGPVALETLVLEGDPAETLCRHAAGADLLVVGSRGRGTFAGLLLGSVSSKCAHHSPTPVVIVPMDRELAP